jgi:hypothetical protein
MSPDGQLPNSGDSNEQVGISVPEIGEYDCVV